MKAATYRWEPADPSSQVDFVAVAGTGGEPFRFADGEATRTMHVGDFWIATTPVTVAFWKHIMRDCPAIGRGPRRPLENISWDNLHRAGGFLERINAGAIRAQLATQTGRAAGVFRLPAETEWEYAARGGPAWRDGYRYSGGNDVDCVAWHDRIGGDCTKDVALKAANQLGLFDLSGNVWEWCEDTYTETVDDLPAEGRPHTASGTERVLRGGCSHNWAMHCTVSKRYHIEPHFNDGCIGFRLVFS